MRLPTPALANNPVNRRGSLSGHERAGLDTLQSFASGDGKRYCFSIVKDVTKVPFINKSVNFKN